MTAFEPFDTARLRLRLLRESDAEDIHAYQRLPEVVEYMFWQVRTLDETREHLARRLQTTALENDGDVLVVGVELADAGHPVPRHASAPAPTHPHAATTLGGVDRYRPRLIGEITVFLHSVANGQAEIGWAFHPAFQGHGYATEAAGRMLDWAFATLGAHRVEAHLDPRNTASAAVCSRLGMTQDALLRENLRFKGAWGDTAIYGILAADRAALSARPAADRAALSARPAAPVGGAGAAGAAGAVAAGAVAARAVADRAVAAGAGGAGAAGAGAAGRTAARELPQIRVAAVVLLRERRVLMVTARGRDVLYLPGGKIDDGETSAEALVRECREEIAVELEGASIRRLFTVTVQAHGEPVGRMVEMELFAATTPDEPTASAEVDSVHWVTSADAHRCPPAGVETLERLASLDLID